jgi:hypothetical protein
LESYVKVPLVDVGGWELETRVADWLAVVVLILVVVTPDDPDMEVAGAVEVVKMVS